jgi:hypothetical protein
MSFSQGTPALYQEVNMGYKDIRNRYRPSSPYTVAVAYPYRTDAQGNWIHSEVVVKGHDGEVQDHLRLKSNLWGTFHAIFYVYPNRLNRGKLYSLFIDRMVLKSRLRINLGRRTEEIQRGMKRFSEKMANGDPYVTMNVFRPSWDRKGDYSLFLKRRSYKELFEGGMSKDVHFLHERDRARLQQRSMWCLVAEKYHGPGTRKTTVIRAYRRVPNEYLHDLGLATTNKDLQLSNG